MTKYAYAKYDIYRSNEDYILVVPADADDFGGYEDEYSVIIAESECLVWNESEEGWSHIVNPFKQYWSLEDSWIHIIGDPDALNEEIEELEDERDDWERKYDDAKYYLDYETKQLQLKIDALGERYFWLDQLIPQSLNVSEQMQIEQAIRTVLGKVV